VTLLLVVAFTVLFVAGAALIVTAFGEAAPEPATGGAGWPRLDGLAAPVLGGTLVGTVVFVVSGWLVPGAVAGGGAGWAIAAWRRRQHHGEAEIARLEALASWIESVRDVLLAGEQPIGAITSSVAACPAAIRPHVRRLATGLTRQDPDAVFRRFADDLDDPLGDLVAAGLSIAVRRGARTVAVLTALAEQAREQVDRRRLVEAERAPTRREVQALTVIMDALVLGLLVLGRNEYLDAYDTAGGQLFLACALAGYALLLVRVQRLAAFPRPGRFLTAKPSLHEAGQ
jgi:hypothetical protein